MRFASLLIIVLLVGAGCQSAQVRNRCIALDGEVPTVYNQLVLDNVAMAVAAPCNMPYFGLAAQNTNANTQGLTAGATPTWQSVPLHTLALPFSGTNQDQATIQLIPVTDPDRIELLRLLFHAAAHSCCGNRLTDSELDTLASFYNARTMPYFDYSTGVLLEAYPPPRQPDPKPGPGLASATFQGNLAIVPFGGNVDIKGPPQMPPAKLRTFVVKPCLFCVTGKHEVPKDACLVGHYCDTYVSVPPQCADNLRRLTMAALDVATVGLTTTVLRGAPKPRGANFAPSDETGVGYGRAEPRVLPFPVAPPPAASVVP
jgi:hypothetical protein